MDPLFALMALVYFSPILIPIVIALAIIVLNLIHIGLEFEGKLTEFSCEHFGLNVPEWLKFIVTGGPFFVLSGSAILAVLIPSPVFFAIAGGGFLGDLIFTHLIGSFLLRSKVPGTNWFTTLTYPIAGVALIVMFPSWWALLGAIPFLFYWPGFSLVADYLKGK